MLLHLLILKILVRDHHPLELATKIGMGGGNRLQNLEQSKQRETSVRGRTLFQLLPRLVNQLKRL